MKQGTQYRFFVPSCQSWTDLFIWASADGYPRSPISFVQELFRGLKPLATKNWFDLVDAIDRPIKCPFLIASGTNAITMKANGELVSFYEGRDRLLLEIRSARCSLQLPD